MAQKYNIYFEDQHTNTSTYLGCAEDEGVWKIASSYIHTNFPNVKIYYIRSWLEGTSMWYDYGSYTRFVRATPAIDDIIA